MGLLHDRVPENMSYLLDIPIRGNVSFYSRWVNNDSQSAYWDYIYNRTRNANRTLEVGESVGCLDLLMEH